MESGLVFHIQKYSLQDGPGIRTTVFLKGCPLCCAWCHNPESQSPRPEIIVVEGRCIACGQCHLICPFAQAVEEGPLPARVPDCTLCGECASACPTGARQMVGQRMTVAEVTDAVLQDRVFYEDSAGGVTVSGGEPLMQPQFLKALLGACRVQGLRTAVDTCGFACTDVLREVAPLTDLILYDLKSMDDVTHRHYTGVSNAPILANLRALDEIHAHLWLRVPIIPGINDSEQSLEAVARFAATLSSLRQVNLLPYHKIGVHKFRRLGQKYALEGVEPPSPERMDRALNLFRDHGLTTKVGG